MAISVYSDVGKTLSLGELKAVISNGLKNKFYVGYPVAAVLLNGVKTERFTAIGDNVILSTAPNAGVQIAFIPENSLEYYFLSNAAGDKIESIYIDTDQDFYLLSEDIVNGGLGSYLFSTDGSNYYTCIQVTIGTDIQVYVKFVFAGGLDVIKNSVKDRLVLVDSSVPITTDGYIDISFTPPSGTPGVEIHEDIV